MTSRFNKNNWWALILGGSSGFGLAAAQKLASCGMNIAIVHRDRRGAMRRIEPEFEKIRTTEVGFDTFNLDALSDVGRTQVLDDLTDTLGKDGRIRLVMHSIAFGNLKPIAPVGPGFGNTATQARARLAEQLGIEPDTLAEAVNKVFEADGGDALAALADAPGYSEAILEDEDFARTIYSMGTSLTTWVQDIFKRGMFADDARVVGMTSEGNEVAWRGYAAVSAAKVALESVSRSIALEMAPYGIRSNIVQAGVTDTPALRLIPGSAHMKAGARRRNPFGRLTTPQDVADFICLLCTDEAHWVNGTIIRVDGGEHIAG
jgi:NAD(P)-dependent dehydrogenase (short-subunit alcohol dehydrogenase family)